MPPLSLSRLGFPAFRQGAREISFRFSGEMVSNSLDLRLFLLLLLELLFLQLLQLLLFLFVSSQFLLRPLLLLPLLKRFTSSRTNLHFEVGGRSTCVFVVNHQHFHSLTFGLN